MDQLSSSQHIWLEITTASAIGLVLLPSSPIHHQEGSFHLEKKENTTNCNTPNGMVNNREESNSCYNDKYIKIGESIQSWIYSSLKELDFLFQQKLDRLPNCFMFSPGLFVCISFFLSYLFNEAIYLV